MEKIRFIFEPFGDLVIRLVVPVAWHEDDSLFCLQLPEGEVSFDFFLNSLDEQRPNISVTEEQNFLSKMQ